MDTDELRMQCLRKEIKELQNTLMAQAEFLLLTMYDDLLGQAIKSIKWGEDTMYIIFESDQVAIIRIMSDSDDIDLDSHMFVDDLSRFPVDADLLDALEQKRLEHRELQTRRLRKQNYLRLKKEFENE